MRDAKIQAITLKVFFIIPLGLRVVVIFGFKIKLKLYRLVQGSDSRRTQYLTIAFIVPKKLYHF